MYLGDFRLGETFDTKFTTISSTGAPITLAGTPAVAAYPGNSTTEITAGITLTVDFDARTGLHNVRVVATSGNGYATATNYVLVLTAGTVDGVSVVGYAIAHFSIEARSALMPTTAARTLDVSAGGEAGVDWANVGSPTTAVNLSATNIDVDQIVASVSGAVASVTGAVGSVAAGGITAASFAANAITAAKLDPDVTTELQSGLATAAALDTVDNFLDTEIAAIITTLGTPAGVSISADIAAVKSDSAAILTDTGTTLQAELDAIQAAVITNAAGVDIAADIIALKAETAAILADTDVIGATGAGLTSLASQSSVNTIDDFLDTEVAAILAAVDTEVAAIKTKTDNMPNGVAKNTALAGFTFLMVDSTDHVTGKTGLTVTAVRSLDGAAFGACANAVTELSDGLYTIDLAAGDLNGNNVVLKFTATGADATVIGIKTSA